MHAGVGVNHKRSEQYEYQRLGIVDVLRVLCIYDHILHPDNIDNVVDEVHVREFERQYRAKVKTSASRVCVMVRKKQLTVEEV